MSRIADRDRVLLLLDDTEGLSNLKVKNELNLADERYRRIRDQLIEERLLEKYVCRGGGIRLTRRGEREVPRAKSGPDSTVEREAALYEPLAAFLRQQAEEDEVEAVVCNTHSLKARGQWQNPDVTQVAIEYYPLIRKMRVVVTTFEVKQFPHWSVDAVYEAASHHRFSHEAWVVLEWPKGLISSLTDPTHKLDQIARECQRFGIGLASLQPHYNSFRLSPRLEPKPRTPEDEDVESWLTYVFSRMPTLSTEFDERMKKVASAVVA
jgi:hypothetical protein